LPLREDERRLLRALKPRLRPFDDEALNAEPTPALLDAAITPIESFFVRNNGWLPKLENPKDWTLTVDGEVERPCVLSLQALRAFEPVSVTAVLECAGNGRAGFDPPTDGVQWARGAVGCAHWTGIRLADVLRHAGVKPSAIYTGHHSGDVQTNGSGAAAISRGIPIEKALSPETLLAFTMNGEALPFLHGGPLRLVVPGYPGSAWQKWLTRIALRDREHDGEKMTGTDYRLPRMPVPPGEPFDERDFEVITEMPVNSLITMPAENFSVCAGSLLHVHGFAWSGRAPVASVTISADGGATWQPAELEPEGERFAWRRFTATLQLDQMGPVSIRAKAADAAGNVQPDEPPWNPRGYCNHSVHRVAGTVVP